MQDNSMLGFAQSDTLQRAVSQCGMVADANTQAGKQLLHANMGHQSCSKSILCVQTHGAKCVCESHQLFYANS
jgi:hypothetical protein